MVELISYKCLKKRFPGGRLLIKFPRFHLNFVYIQVFYTFSTKIAWAYTFINYWFEKVDAHCYQGWNIIDYLNFLAVFGDAFIYICLFMLACPILTGCVKCVGLRDFEIIYLSYFLAQTVADSESMPDSSPK